jgi:hypothetical protein
VGVASIALEYIPSTFHKAHRNVHAVELGTNRGARLVVWPVMKDYGERAEAGIVVFSLDQSLTEVDDLVSLPAAFQGRLELLELVAHDEDARFSSGIILRATNGTELVIAAADFPLALAVSAPGVAASFELEWIPERYERVPF